MSNVSWLAVKNIISDISYYLKTRFFCGCCIKFQLEIRAFSNYEGVWFNVQDVYKDHKRRMRQLYIMYYLWIWRGINIHNSRKTDNMGLSYWVLSTKKKKKKEKIPFKWKEIIPSRMCKDKLEKCDLFDCDSSLQHLTDMNQMTFPWEHMLKTNWSFWLFRNLQR